LVNIQNNFKRKSDIRKFTDTAFKFILYGTSVLKNTGNFRPFESLVEIIVLRLGRAMDDVQWVMGDGGKEKGRHGDGGTRRRIWGYGVLTA